MSGLRKVHKKDPMKTTILKVPPKLDGAAYFYGRIKSGKTVSILSFAGLYHDHPQRKYKIFDLWGGDRNEHLYWALPSNKDRYWNYTKKLLQLKGQGPTQYKVNLLYPLTDKLPKKLPQNLPYVHSKIFTIPIKDIEIEDISLLIGSPSETSAGLWKESLSETKKGANPSQIITKYMKSGENTILFKNFLKPLAKQGLLQDKDCIYNMDSKAIKQEMLDQDTITVLCLDFVDKEDRLFILGYLIRMMTKELDRKRTQTIGIFREASEFFRVNDQSVVHDRYKIFRNQLSQWIRMGRRGFHPFLDTQSPCLIGDTEIKIVENNKIVNKKIKELPKNITVESYDFDAKNKIKTPGEVAYIGEKDTYSIELEDGTMVSATSNHRFFDDKNNEIYVSELKTGDYILKDD